ncbi:MAG: 16S rRNA (guanine(527)-N(7))-methyltransferase RsmG [Mycoplasmataceae bacterium]|nr:16S rRNA (guanine(527)-N(7))-methyltransferase RsmG [Mycoplasmataceae bacterium]
MTENEFKKKINSIFINIDTNFFSNIEKYKMVLQAYNKKMNLTRLEKEEKIYGQYFYESILPFAQIDFNKYKNILDIGSGSGIPGIVLKLLYPNNISLTVIEANKKKADFLKFLANELNIMITLLNKRAENIQNSEREKYDLVTSRAVAELKVILEISAPYCKINGLIVEPKGKKVKIELNNAANMIDQLNLILLPKTNLIFQKNKKNDLKFPRKWTEIIKN